jgi:hypothetical protein
MFDPPEFTESYDWLAETAAKLLQAGPGETGIKVIDLSEVSSGIVPLVTGVLARLVYGVQFWIAPSRRTRSASSATKRTCTSPPTRTSGPSTARL